MWHSKALVLVSVVSCASDPPKQPDVAALPGSPSSETTTTSSAPKVEPCLHVTGAKETLEGVVSCAEHSHPNGSHFRFCFITLDQPRCVEGSSDAKSVQEVQLIGNPDFTALKGQRTRVTGSLSGGLTAWHVRPVLIDVDSFNRP